MRDDEIVEVHQTLIDIIRRRGLESLFEPISTPFDVATTGSGSRTEIRRLVEGLIGLMELLPRLESSIAANEPDIGVVVFEVDPTQSDDRVLGLPKIERGSENIGFDRYRDLRQTQIGRAHV